MSNIAIREITIDLPFIGEKDLVLSPQVRHGSYVTVLIGKNGSGKSTLLRDLTTALRDSYTGSKRSSRASSRVTRIKIENDGHVVTIEGLRSGKSSSEQDHYAARAATPKKVIALSFTPFDKFPTNAGYTNKDKLNPDLKKETYVYLGFKGGVRASPRSLLRRSIDQLALANASYASDHHVSDVFAVLGYEPRLTIQYQMNRLDKVLNSPHIDRGYIESLIEQVRPAFRSGRGVSGPALSYEFDFLHGGSYSSNNVEFETFRQLVRANVLQMTSANLRRHNGQEVELLDLSSGELNLLSGFLGLAANLEDGCLVLIDEPENSLHPAWQLEYIQMLDALLKSRRGCHYIIATHSPLIVSGFAGRDCSVLRLDQNPVVVDDDAISNSSPDATLVSAFSIVTPDNHFLKQLVLEALALIEQGRHKEERAQSIAKFLASLQSRIPDEGLRVLVRNVCASILEL